MLKNNGCPASMYGTVSMGHLLRASTSQSLFFANDTLFDVENAPGGNFTREGVCIHEDGETRGPPFPPGDYCVYKLNDESCPNGFEFAVLVNSGGMILRKNQVTLVKEGEN